MPSPRDMQQRVVARVTCLMQDTQGAWQHDHQTRPLATVAHAVAPTSMQTTVGVQDRDGSYLEQMHSYYSSLRVDPATKFIQAVLLGWTSAVVRCLTTRGADLRLWLPRASSMGTKPSCPPSNLSSRSLWTICYLDFFDDGGDDSDSGGPVVEGKIISGHFIEYLTKPAAKALLQLHGLTPDTSDAEDLSGSSGDSSDDNHDDGIAGAPSNHPGGGGNDGRGVAKRMRGGGCS